MDLRLKPRIGVMGPALCLPEVYNLAREVGQLIGKKGAILICGGRSGVMEASARGAREAGGKRERPLDGGQRLLRPPR